MMVVAIPGRGGKINVGTRMQPVFDDKPTERNVRSRGGREFFSLPPFPFQGEAMTVEANPRERALAIDIGDTYLFAMISNAPLSRALLS